MPKALLRPTILIAALVCLVWSRPAVAQQPDPSPLDAMAAQLAGHSGSPVELLDALLADERQAVIQQVARGSQRVNLGRLLLAETFDAPDDWVSFEPENGSLRVNGGAYRITLEDVRGTNRWGGGGVLHDNVVIQVETRQLSQDSFNGYGVICRAQISETGTESGYFFRISGDGFYSIHKVLGRQIIPVVDWRPSDVIRQGAAANTLLAVCLGNYLALYVNGQLVTETLDAQYTQGVVGLSAVAYEGQSVDVTFDNLLVWRASTD